MTRAKDSPNADNRQTAISVRYSEYSEAFDVYSFDVLIWQAFSQGKVSYESYISDNDIRQRKVNDEKLPN
jgi:hypothetical protein